MKSKPISIYSLLFLICGIFIGVLFCNWSFFEFDQKIQADNLISLLITSVIGVYIAKTIQGQHSSVRNEKEFFIAEIKECKELVQKINSFAQNCTFPFEEIKVRFRELNRNLTMLKGLISNSKNCNGVDFTTVLDKLWELRRAITGKSPDANNNIIVSSSEKFQIEQHISLLKKELLQIILTINR